MVAVPAGALEVEVEPPPAADDEPPPEDGDEPPPEALEPPLLDDVEGVKPENPVAT
jgi:hypothetical protein